MTANDARLDFHAVLAAMAARDDLAAWAAQLPQQIAAGLDQGRWGDLPQWRQALADLPALQPRDCDFGAQVRIGREADASDAQREQLRAALMALHPWRKGPFDLFGLHLDAEWRSDWKWERVAPHLDLRGHWVLDVGCGNGYYGWRMHGAGAARVIGIDPSAKFVCQHAAIAQLARGNSTAAPYPVDVLPLGIDDVPPQLRAFDTTFSMGVLYHRRSPIDHILALKDTLKPGGTLVLETLVIDGDSDAVLVPGERYAQMRNVWFLPSVPALENWLARCGLLDIACLEVAVTTTEEQRATEWMHFHSLANFLDPADPTRTVEGYPAPRRALLRARVPG